jgi:hypothetical protein
MHQSKLSLDHDVEARPVAVRTCLAVSCNTCIDQTGVDFADGCVVKVVFLQGTGEVVFDEDVTVAGELLDDFDAFGVCE